MKCARCADYVCLLPSPTILHHINIRHHRIINSATVQEKEEEDASNDLRLSVCDLYLIANITSQCL